MSNNIAIDDPVDMELLNMLKTIHSQLIKLAPNGGALPEFGAPNLAGHEYLIAFLQYLKDLSWIVHSGHCWNPKCDDGTCPPCFNWTISDYKSYLESLNNKQSA
jgi:hypothetical protein